ncbi:hypothetical protein [Polynucleobacter sp. MWH-HuK1]|nr:hypothetical protein [Polynucleobacter sp. MWH-HuK1]
MAVAVFMAGFLQKIKITGTIKVKDAPKQNVKDLQRQVPALSF